jgi:hypothetical protein
MTEFGDRMAAISRGDDKDQRIASLEAERESERERVKTAHAEGADAIIASFSNTDLRGRVCELEAENAELARAHAAAESELTAALSRAENVEIRLARIVEWTHVFGKALCPPGADTYGEGIRDAKAQVAALAAKEG